MIGSLFGWLISNPMVILIGLGVFAFSSVLSDVKGYFHSQDLVRPWVQAVKDRDAAAVIKDQMTEEALLARENAFEEIQVLHAQLDEAEAARNLAGVVECRWTDDDARVLNSAAKRAN